MLGPDRSVAVASPTAVGRGRALAPVVVARRNPRVAGGGRCSYRAMARRHVYSLITVALALAAIVLPSSTGTTSIDHGGRSLVGGAVGLDGFSMFIDDRRLRAVALAALLADDYLRTEGLDGAELYALMLLAASGGIVMASANDLIVLFLGVEILSIALYVLAGSAPPPGRVAGGGLKYFVLGGFSSAFLLYGIALVYGATGTTNLDRDRHRGSPTVCSATTSTCCSPAWP